MGELVFPHFSSQREVYDTKRESEWSLLKLGWQPGGTETSSGATKFASVPASRTRRILKGDMNLLCGLRKSGRPHVRHE